MFSWTNSVVALGDAVKQSVNYQMVEVPPRAQLPGFRRLASFFVLQMVDHK